MHIKVTNEEIEQLVRELASLYSATADAVVVAQHTGVNNHATYDKAITTWNSVVTEACKQGKILQLIERAQRDYPDNEVLTQLQQVFLARSLQDHGNHIHTTVDHDDDLHVRRTLPRFLITSAIVIAIAITSFLVYRSWRAEIFPQVKIQFTSFRDPLIYYVSLHDKPPAETQFVVSPNADRYIFYSTYVRYTRSPPRRSNKMYIVAITNSSTYAQWVRTDDVLYREIIGIDQADKPLFESLTRQIDSAQTSKEKLAALSAMIEIEFRVDGLLLELDEFKREPFGYALGYKNPLANSTKSSATYEFKCRTFQPRSITNFPFIVSELARNVDYKLDYSDVTVDTPEFFSAFLYNPISDPVVANDAANKVLTVHSRGSEWVYPGGGIILYWK